MSKQNNCKNNSTRLLCTVTSIEKFCLIKNRLWHSLLGRNCRKSQNRYFSYTTVSQQPRNIRYAWWTWQKLLRVCWQFRFWKSHIFDKWSFIIKTTSSLVVFSDPRRVSYCWPLRGVMKVCHHITCFFISPLVEPWVLLPLNLK